MKKILALVLALCIAASLCACGKGNTIEGKGYKTPEEALLAYAEALKTGDLDKILATFAVETHVKNYDMKTFLDQVKTFNVAGEYILPPAEGLSQEMAVLQRQYAITRQVSWLLGYTQLGDDWGIPLSIHENGDYKSSSKFLKKLEQNWAEILSEMEIDDIVEPEDLVDEDKWEMVEDNAIKAKRKYLGCDELVALALEIELDGEDYYLIMDIACYDGKWYNCTPGGTIASILGVPSTSGGLSPR